MDASPTKLDYYEDMWKLQSKATLLSYFKVSFSLFKAFLVHSVSVSSLGFQGPLASEKVSFWINKTHLLTPDF